jgi:cytochrome P450
MAMEMTALIVGLTETKLSKLAKRLEKSVSPVRFPKGNPLYPLVVLAYGRINSVIFYFQHVRPAIRARRAQPREDVISHLLSLGYDNQSIMIECATYGAAGMSTTREFMTLAIWHLLDRPELKARFMAATVEEKRSILEEILRLEPVVSQIERRALADIELNHRGEKVIIPKGTMIRIDTRGANHDETASGACPLSLNPDRKIDANTTRALLTFSDGNHRCPGSYVALQESAIFLTKLLEIPGLRIARAPKVTRNMQVGYELRGLTLTTSPA